MTALGAPQVGDRVVTARGTAKVVAVTWAVLYLRMDHWLGLDKCVLTSQVRVIAREAK